MANCSFTVSDVMSKHLFGVGAGLSSVLQHGQPQPRDGCIIERSKVLRPGRAALAIQQDR